MGMNPEDLRKILTALMMGQGRQFSEDDFDFWDNLIGDLDGAVAYDAVMTLLKKSDAFITPAHIRQECSRIALDRLQSVEQLPAPPSGLSPEEYKTWLRAVRGAIMRGQDETVAGGEGRKALGRAPEAPTLVAIPAGQTAHLAKQLGQSWAQGGVEVVDAEIVED